MLLALPTSAVRDLARGNLPAKPGVYLWRHNGNLAYVGKAKSLQGRAWGKHLGAGVSLASSSLRRNVCELLFSIQPTITGNPVRQKVSPEQALAIREWLLECEVSWQVCETEQAAISLERRLRRDHLPPLNRV